jgi:hypothetical protein
MMEMKMGTPIELLFRNMPVEFATYMAYFRSLRFEDRPDNSYSKRLFKDLFFRENYPWDFILNWTIPQRKSSRA